jgi:hypothetical protein
METATLTENDIVRRHAEDIAYAADTDPASNLDSLIGQLDSAARNFQMAGINGHEDLETASTLLSEARQASDDTARGALLQHADKLLDPLYDMNDELSCI